MTLLRRALALLLLLGAGYVVFRDHLPPQTALASARAISGLALPGGTTIVSIERIGFDGPRGDGIVTVVVRLPADAFDRIAAEAARAGYRPLHDAPEAGSTFLDHPIGSEGWYRQDRVDESGSSRTVVLDAGSHTILMRQVFG